jgi:hypothetical protein
MNYPLGIASLLIGVVLILAAIAMFWMSFSADTLDLAHPVGTRIFAYFIFLSGVMGGYMGIRLFKNARRQNTLSSDQQVGR